MTKADNYTHENGKSQQTNETMKDVKVLMKMELLLQTNSNENQSDTKTDSHTDKTDDKWRFSVCFGEIRSIVHGSLNLGFIACVLKHTHPSCVCVCIPTHAHTHLYRLNNMHRAPVCVRRHIARSYT